MQGRLRQSTDAISVGTDHEAEVVDFWLHEGTLIETNTKSTVGNSLENALEASVMFGNGSAGDDNVVEVCSSTLESRDQSVHSLLEVAGSGFTPKHRRLHRLSPR